jgi:hypothetical protein
MLHAVLRYAWAAPATAVGLLLLVVARSAGATIATVDGTIEVAGGGIAFLIPRLPRFLRFNAITFGHVILGTDHEMLALCRTHERVHVLQYERWGILFFPLYVGSSLIELMRGRSPYWHNWFEREARERAGCASETPATRTERDNTVS